MTAFWSKYYKCKCFFTKVVLNAGRGGTTQIDLFWMLWNDVLGTVKSVLEAAASNHFDVIFGQKIY